MCLHLSQIAVVHNVVASTVFGVLTGEWARTGTRPIRTMIAGVSLLVLAIAILSYAGRV